MFNAWGILKSKKVTVVGDVMLVQYWSGGVDRISPEAPVPVVKVSSENSQLGGAGNVAVNLAELGLVTELHAVIGSDSAGETVSRLVSSHSIASGLQAKTGATTTHKLRVLGMSQQLIRLDFEEDKVTASNTIAVDPSQVDLSTTDVLLLSDYIKGSLADPQPLIQAAKARRIPILVDTKVQDLELYRGITLLKPNRREFELLVGCCSDHQEIEDKARVLMQQYDIENVLVTLGKEGMLLVSSAGPTEYFTPKARDVFDVTGAGDTVIATVAAVLAVGGSWCDAVELANRAAGIVVGKLGTAAITAAELHAAQLQEGTQNIVCTPEELMSQVAAAKINGERVVMTNGCFDILHAGHVQYLQQAKALGDRLVIAVNSDDSVKRLKGDSRPVNALSDREEVLAALRAVDWVVSFSEDTPQALIEKIMPDVLVKGGDYKVEEIAGSAAVLAHGGEVKILPLRPGCSSTRIIESTAT
jgi:D-beta-D-heptose 7-phosphate kinase / D-beta-D-heptose 1-phosphate adenosyltransferase